MEKLLIVEDDKTLSEGLCYILKESGYFAEAVSDIYHARKILEKETPDLMILDCNLPDGNGYVFCRELQNKAHGKILILTARNTELDEVQAFKTGADDYISKPFSTAVFLERVKNLLRRRDSHILVSDGIEVDLAGGRAYLEKEEIVLTAVEFKLLCYFMENKSQLLTKDMIIEHVWNGDSESADDNNLFVRINRLRQKVESDSKNPKRIITIRGMGYIWREG
ncbi:MAG: response regulator transcription factor [Lachnospiraceae bacterium]|nr:response regulator transcription factor [Lachnospiraceae bacterium]